MSDGDGKTYEHPPDDTGDKIYTEVKAKHESSVKSSNIKEGFDVLENRIEEIDRHVHDLWTRLSPVLTPNTFDDTKDPGPTGEPQSDIATLLHAHAMRLELVNRMIVNTLDRLEL